MKVSIIGATGYTGAELLRLLGGHPEADIRYITSESSAGKSIAEVYPHLQAVQEAKLVSMEALDEVAADSDVLFIALPHGHAMAVGKRLEKTDVKIIDLGADFRLEDEETYKTTKIGDQVTLGHDKRSIGELRGFHMIVSLFFTAIALIILVFSWLIWLFCHSDSKTYIQYFRGK